MPLRRGGEIDSINRQIESIATEGHSFARLGAGLSEGAPAMRFVLKSSVVLVAFWFNAAAQEGYLDHDHDK
jgi:hypothetical protein